MWKWGVHGTWQVELLLLARALRGGVQGRRGRRAGRQRWGRRGGRGGGGGRGVAAGVWLVGHRDLVLQDMGKERRREETVRAVPAGATTSCPSTEDLGDKPEVPRSSQFPLSRSPRKHPEPQPGLFQSLL